MQLPTVLVWGTAASSWRFATPFPSYAFHTCSSSSQIMQQNCQPGFSTSRLLSLSPFLNYLCSSLTPSSILVSLITIHQKAAAHSAWATHYTLHTLFLVSLLCRINHSSVKMNTHCKTNYKSLMPELCLVLSKTWYVSKYWLNILS